MKLQEKLQTKVRELEQLRVKLTVLDLQKQRVLELALETQGAVKQLVELTNEEKEKNPCPLIRKSLKSK